MAEQIKNIEPGARELYANGRRFVIHETLTVDGFQKMEELRLEIETGTTAADAVKTIGKAVDALKSNNVFTASVHCYNATASLERIAAKVPHPLLLMLTLFVRPEGSDLSNWNEADAILWLEDLNKEGYNINDLFTLADACRQAFALNFLRNSPDILQVEDSEGQNEQASESAQ